jgi:Gram-negative bacterial TonB protein C-terminal
MMIERLVGLAGTTLVHALGLWAAPLLVPPSPPPPPPGITCMCTLPPTLHLPRVSVVSVPAADRASSLWGPRPARARCRPGSGIDRVAEPLLDGQGPALVAWTGLHAPVICARIGSDGQVGATSLILGSGDPATDRAALVLLRRLRFRPAEQDGRPRSANHVVIVRPGGSA